MGQKYTREQLSKILQMLDEALDKGPWETSNFLKAIGKNLRQLRDDFSVHVEKHHNPASSDAEELEKSTTLETHQQEIFITLYSADGADIFSWERILSNLPKQVVSRPIYGKEEEARTMMRSKENRMNEAYVSVVINSSDILPAIPDKTVTDKFGKILLSLKDRVIQLDNIKRFMHLTGEYRYYKGKLIKKA